MDFTALVDVAIGLSLLYLGASLFVTILNEYMAQLGNWRTLTLQRSLKELFGEATLADLGTALPALQRVLDAKKPMGSYVDADALAQALVGKLRADATTAAKVGDLVTAIRALPEGSKIKTVLLGISQAVGDEVKTFTANLSSWIDRSLTALGEGYKQKIQRWSFGIGLVIAVAFNVDTLHVTQRLYSDHELRRQVVAFAEDYTKRVTPDLFTKCTDLDAVKRQAAGECKEVRGVVDAVLRQEKIANIPIGWTSLQQAWDEGGPGLNVNWLLRWLGWLLTALAISLGAPFWFDLLNKFVNVRHAMKKPEPQEKK